MVVRDHVVEEDRVELRERKGQVAAEENQANVESRELWGHRVQRVKREIWGHKVSRGNRE